MKKLSLALALALITACGSSHESELKNQENSASDTITLSPAASDVIVGILKTEHVPSEYAPGPVAARETTWMVKSLACTIGSIELTSPSGGSHIERNSCYAVTFYNNQVEIVDDNAKTLANTLANSGAELTKIFGLDLSRLAVTALICTSLTNPKAGEQKNSCSFSPANG